MFISFVYQRSGPAATRGSLSAPLTGTECQGGALAAELPNPVNFEAASATVTADDIRETFSVGPDPEVHVQNAQKYVDAGFDRVRALKPRRG